MSRYLAFDLGAESGRAMLGSLEGGRLTLEELHRFPNTPVTVFSSIYWDTLRLWHEMQHALALAGRERKLVLNGIAVDTWGVDCALLAADGSLIENPRHYRDPRNNGMVEKAFKAVPREQIFEKTGIQFMPLNTIYQLAAETPERLAAAGFREIVLTGVNVGDYGRKERGSLLELLKLLGSIGGVDRIRISSIEPNLLSRELVDFILESEKFCNHFHIPLQSGSDRVLKSMRRRYLSDHYRSVVDYIKQKDPDAGNTP